MSACRLHRNWSNTHASRSDELPPVLFLQDPRQFCMQLAGDIHSTQVLVLLLCESRHQATGYSPLIINGTCNARTDEEAQISLPRFLQSAVRRDAWTCSVAHTPLTIPVTFRLLRKWRPKSQSNRHTNVQTSLFVAQITYAIYVSGAVHVKPLSRCASRCLRGVTRHPPAVVYVLQTEYKLLHFPTIGISSTVCLPVSVLMKAPFGHHEVLRTLVVWSIGKDEGMHWHWL
jgi:hypothetical protein